MGDVTLVDAHVHLQPCFDIDPFLTWARTNFENATEHVERPGEHLGVLCLTEISSGLGFERLLGTFDYASGKGRRSGGHWEPLETDEPSSVCLIQSSDYGLVVIAGRQLASEEGLEVLAIGTRRSFEEGQSLRALVQAVSRAGAIPVVPWGVGKWFGRRGQRVEEVIRNPNLPPFFLGDSGNRPKFWPQPSEFEMAEERGIRNLPGSDPLPFPDEVQRVGSVGVALEGRLDLETPTQDLKERLRDPSATFQPFGQREKPFRFMRNQLRMQLRKLTQ